MPLYLVTVHLVVFELVTSLLSFFFQFFLKQFGDIAVPFICLIIMVFTSCSYILQRHEERVIIISSKDGENVISDAENALQQIASLILKVM